MRVDVRCRAGDGSVLRVWGIVPRLSAVRVAREADDLLVKIRMVIKSDIGDG